MKKLPKLTNVKDMERMFNDLKKEKDPIQRSTLFYTIIKEFMFPLLIMGNSNKTDTPAECITFVAIMEFIDSVFGKGDKYNKLLYIKDVLEKEIDKTDEMKLFKDLESKPETLH